MPAKHEDVGVDQDQDAKRKERKALGVDQGILKAAPSHWICRWICRWAWRVQR